MFRSLGYIFFTSITRAYISFTHLQMKQGLCKNGFIACDIKGVPPGKSYQGILAAEERIEVILIPLPILFTLTEFPSQGAIDIPE